MINTFTLRCTLLFVRLVYFLTPVVKFLCKVLLIGLLAIVAFLVLLLII